MHGLVIIFKKKSKKINNPGINIINNSIDYVYYIYLLI